MNTIIIIIIIIVINIIVFIVVIISITITIIFLTRAACLLNPIITHITVHVTGPSGAGLQLALSAESGCYLGQSGISPHLITPRSTAPTWVARGGSSAEVMRSRVIHYPIISTHIISTDDNIISIWIYFTWDILKCDMKIVMLKTYKYKLTKNKSHCMCNVILIIWLSIAGDCPNVWYVPSWIWARLSMGLPGNIRQPNSCGKILREQYPIRLHFPRKWT